VLAREARVERTHGGAAVPVERPAEQAFAVREAQEIEAKRAIAAAAVALLEPGSTVFLNDGSTVMSLAREIVARRLRLFVATPALNVATRLAESAAVTACLLGGFVRETSLATWGPFAERMLEQINADLALLSPDGFSLRHGLSFAQAEDAAIARKMMQQASRCVALVTGSKLSRVGRISAAPATAVQTLVTDRIEPALRERLEARGIAVVVAEAASDAAA
jgi:DeoR/GlpR family transcriptional regulator of sugar metabolism